LGSRVYDYILTPVINADGMVEAVSGVTRDITDIRNAETAITESEARFRVMAESTDVMIALSDETGNAVFFNEAWTTVTGRTPAELLKYGWLDLVHPDEKDGIRNNFSAALKEGKSWQWEFRIPDSKGTYRWLLARGTPRFRSDGSFVGYVSSTIDITEIKENEQRKSDFISMVSHELKTPLTSAISYVQVSEKIALQYEDTRVAIMLERAGKQLGKMTRMINGFLNVSRLESGKIHMDREQFDISILMKEALEEAAAGIDSHALQFEPAGEILVNADREKIGQVINNLITNAIKYSMPGSVIKVACIQVNGRVQVSVADTGIGISSTDLPRIFERYYRVKDNETRHIAGFGIGLYLCSEIVKGNDGDIRAESEFGEGSTFYFTLPQAA
ncbi:MAG: PAS domain S-box protein, partial [Sphingobacteriales bacterium]